MQRARALTVIGVERDADAYVCQSHLAREIGRVFGVFDHRLEDRKGDRVDTRKRVALAQQQPYPLGDLRRIAGGVGADVHEGKAAAVAPRHDDALLDTVAQQQAIRQPGRRIGERTSRGTNLHESRRYGTGQPRGKDVALHEHRLSARALELGVEVRAFPGEGARDRGAGMGCGCEKLVASMPEKLLLLATAQILRGRVCSDDLPVTIAEQRGGWGLLVQRGQHLARRRELHSQECTAHSPKERRVTPEEIAAFVEGLAAAVAKGEPEALRFAAAMAAERSRNGVTASRRSFWEHLATNGYADEASIREAGTAAGVRLAAAYLAVCLEPEEEAGDVTELRRLAFDIFASSAADLGALEGTSSIDLLVPVAREVDASNARIAATLLPKTIAKRKLTVRVTGGVGGTGTPLEARLHLMRARAALAIGRRIFGPGHVYVYDDLGAYTLLHEGASVERLRLFSQSVLAPLRRYDEKHQTELERTLRLYFELGQNVKTAAAQLNVHRHTVFYRLRQIADISRCDLATPHDQLTLRLALAIDALHS